MRERLNNLNIPDYGTGPSTTNKEMATGSAGLPVDPVEMVLDDRQVSYCSQKFIQKLNHGFQEQEPEKDPSPPPEY